MTKASSKTRSRRVLASLAPLLAAVAAPTAGMAAHRASASSYPAENSRPLAHAAVSARAARRRAHRHGPVLHGNPLRAMRAYTAMQRSYYILGSGLYAGEPFSFLWPFSQALASTVSLANTPALARTFRAELHARLVGLQSYLDVNNSGAPEGTYASTLAAFDGTAAPPTGPGGTKFYDDNDWVGIELMRVWGRTHDLRSLRLAEAIMAFEMAGWQGDPALACPGGIPFSNDLQNTDRNTVSTAPAAELALQLYRATHNAQYLQFAIQAYTWVRTCLLQPGGLYSDHIRRGVVDASVYSYNQGTMVGAGTLLYQVTGNPEYLFQARQTARAALAYFTPTRLLLENPFFPSVYFRNLMYLDSVTHDPPGAKLAQAYVDYAWRFQRLSNNLFVGGSPPTQQLLVQASIVQIYGLLCSPPATYF
jgi:Glycosyl hydrolase family 76